MNWPKTLTEEEIKILQKEWKLAEGTVEAYADQVVFWRVVRPDTDVFPMDVISAIYQRYNHVWGPSWKKIT